MGSQPKMISPYDITSLDNPRLSITQVQLKGDNYDESFSIANGPRIQQLESDLASCRQKGLAICKYDLEKKLAKKQDEKVHTFLMGLDENVYGTTISNILAQDPLPNMNKNGGEKDLELKERAVVTIKVHLLDEEEVEEIVVPLELILSKHEELVPTMERVILMSSHFLDLTSRTVIGAGERRDGGLFYFQEVPTTRVFKTTTTIAIVPFNLWHKRLGHPSLEIHEEPLSQDRGNVTKVNEDTMFHENQTMDDDTLSSPQSPNVDTDEQIQEENLGRGHRKKETSVCLPDYVTNTVKKTSPSLSPPPAQSRFSAIKDKCWRSAMDSELKVLERNQTWTIEELPSNKKALGCKWVYKIKYKSDGTIERFKARIVILGNHQVVGIDYTETFIPVAKMVTVRVFLAVVASKQWELHQMDMHNAFLHGDLEEEVFMKIPPGLNKGKPGEACKLRKSL
ncbi:retrovirus-related pol polyprotein from transposon TNT 1-94 [Tanacetum coccineum]